MLGDLILPSASGIDRVPISSIWITYPVVIKLMLLAFTSLNGIQLLQR